MMYICISYILVRRHWFDLYVLMSVLDHYCYEYRDVYTITVCGMQTMLPMVSQMCCSVEVRSDECCFICHLLRTPPLVWLHIFIMLLQLITHILSYSFFFWLLLLLVLLFFFFYSQLIYIFICRSILFYFIIIDAFSTFTSFIFLPFGFSVILFLCINRLFLKY